MSLWLDSRPLHARRHGKRREIAPREVDVHARWKPEREAEEEEEERDEDRAVDQKQLE